MKRICVWLLVLMMLFSSTTAEQEIADAFTNPDLRYAPGVRWELPLGNTRDEQLIHEINTLHAAGFGVLEITATGHPRGIIPEGYEHAGLNYAAVYGMGSYEWSRTLQTILRRANELGMRVDFHVSVNNGSNKHVPGISPNDKAASKELIAIASPVKDGLPLLEAIKPESKTFISNVDGSEQVLEQHLFAVILTKVVEKNKSIEMLKTMDGSVTEGGGYNKETFEATYDILDFDSIVDVTAYYNNSDSIEKEHVLSKLEGIDLSDGQWEVIGFWWRGDAVAVSGVTPFPSYKIDYFSMDGTTALMNYYKENIFRFGQAGFEDMEALILANGGNIFADSYGANANWANELPAKFEEVTGESIIPYLPAIIYASGSGRRENKLFGYGFTDGSERKVLATIMECMTQLLIENQLQPMCKLCSEIGLEYRDQVVYATSRLDMIAAAAHVDIAEGESLNLVDSPDYFGAMASAAHLLDKDIVSTEHGATFGDTLGLYAYPARMSIRQANRVIQGGVNQYIMHYYTYNDLDYPETSITQWPGFTAMGSRWGAWRENLPEWENINIMTGYFSRVGQFMRQGLVNRDIVIYKQSYWWPRHVRWLWADHALQDAGYTYDFISDGLMSFEQAFVKDGILAPTTAKYKALIFDAQGNRDCQDLPINEISLVAAEKFVEYAKAGLPIIMVGSYPIGLFNAANENEEKRFEDAMETLKSLKNVVLVATEADVPDALKGFGVLPDAENLTPVRISSYHTHNDGIDYYYLYNQSNNYFAEMAEEFKASVTRYGIVREDGGTVQTKIALKGQGVPYLFDLYNGEISRIAEYQKDEQGRIVLDVELVKDQAMLVVISEKDLLNQKMDDELHGTVEGADLVYRDNKLMLRATQSGDYQIDLSNGESRKITAEVNNEVAVSPWELSIKSYKNKNNIDSTGIEATEMVFEVISGITLDSMRGWAEIGTVPVTITKENGEERKEEMNLATISGIGTYTTTVTLPSLWSEKDGLYLIIGDPYDLVVVYVNGQRLPEVDQIGLKVDIGRYLRAGSNKIEIVTNTTLSNAMVALRPDWYGTDRVNQYGLREAVTFIPYVDYELH